MNNNYDRGSFEVTVTESEPAVKLLLLMSGEELLAEVIERFGQDTITVVNPMRVMVQATSADGDDRSATVSFTDWMPLSKDREIVLNKAFIASMTTPLDNLVESYRNG